MRARGRTAAHPRDRLFLRNQRHAARARAGNAFRSFFGQALRVFGRRSAFFRSTFHLIGPGAPRGSASGPALGGQAVPKVILGGYAKAHPQRPMPSCAAARQRTTLMHLNRRKDVRLDGQDPALVREMAALAAAQLAELAAGGVLDGRDVMAHRCGARGRRLALGLGLSAYLVWCVWWSFSTMLRSLPSCATHLTC